jgi:hypothetical protein
MSKSTDEAYEEIIEEFLKKMRAIKTPIPEYKDWLKHSIAEIHMELSAYPGPEDDEGSAT